MPRDNERAEPSPPPAAMLSAARKASENRSLVVKAHSFTNKSTRAATGSFEASSQFVERHSSDSPIVSTTVEELLRTADVEAILQNTTFSDLEGQLDDTMNGLSVVEDPRTSTNPLDVLGITGDPNPQTVEPLIGRGSYSYEQTRSPVYPLEPPHLPPEYLDHYPPPSYSTPVFAPESSVSPSCVTYIATSQRPKTPVDVPTLHPSRSSNARHESRCTTVRSALDLSFEPTDIDSELYAKTFVETEPLPQRQNSLVGPPANIPESKQWFYMPQERAVWHEPATTPNGVGFDICPNPADRTTPVEPFKPPRTVRKPRFNSGFSEPNPIRRKSLARIPIKPRSRSVIIPRRRQQPIIIDKIAPLRSQEYPQIPDSPASEALTLDRSNTFPVYSKTDDTEPTAANDEFLKTLNLKYPLERPTTSSKSSSSSTSQDLQGQSTKVVEALCKKNCVHFHRANRAAKFGHYTYKELIKVAILSTAERKLRLNGIYAWVQQNIPFFEATVDVKEIKAWQNSIRHNLSLNSQPDKDNQIFVKLKNEEATNQPHYWTMTPEAARASLTDPATDTLIDTKHAESVISRIEHLCFPERYMPTSVPGSTQCDIVAPVTTGHRTRDDRPFEEDDNIQSGTRRIGMTKSRASEVAAKRSQQLMPSNAVSTRPRTDSISSIEMDNVKRCLEKYGGKRTTAANVNHLLTKYAHGKNTPSDIRYSSQPSLLNMNGPAGDTKSRPGHHRPKPYPSTTEISQGVKRSVSTVEHTRYKGVDQRHQKQPKAFSSSAKWQRHHDVMQSTTEISQYPNDSDYPDSYPYPKYQKRPQYKPTTWNSEQTQCYDRIHSQPEKYERMSPTPYVMTRPEVRHRNLSGPGYLQNAIQYAPDAPFETRPNVFTPICDPPLMEDTAQHCYAVAKVDVEEQRYIYSQQSSSQRRKYSAGAAVPYVQYKNQRIPNDQHCVLRTRQEGTSKRFSSLSMNNRTPRPIYCNYSPNAAPVECDKHSGGWISRDSSALYRHDHEAHSVHSSSTIREQVIGSQGSSLTFSSQASDPGSRSGSTVVNTCRH